MANTNIASILKGLDLSKPGSLHVWRVQNFELHDIPPASYGTFSTGDSYVVLSTAKTQDAGVKHKIYYWLGKETSQDEAASAAILAQQLDDGMGGSPQQIRVAQGEETDEFKQLFPMGGLNFRQGGVASGFKSTAAIPKATAKLFNIKSPGRAAAQVTEVQAVLSSLCSNASFVLDDDASNMLYVWHGETAGQREKRGALDTATAFRSNRGSLKLAVLDQDDTTSGDASRFYALLGESDPAAAAARITAHEGPGVLGATQAAAAGGSGAANGSADAAAGGGAAASQHVYVLDASGKHTEIPPPPSRSALSPTAQVLLVSGGRCWLWVGSKAGTPNKQAADALARQLLGSSAAAAAGGVEVVKDRMEPGLFMTQFPDWNAAEYAAFKAYEAARLNPNAGHNSPRGGSVGGAAADPTADYPYQDLAARMVKDAQAALAAAAAGGDAASAAGARPATTLPTGGKTTVSVVRGTELTELAAAESGHLFDGEAYVVLYQYTISTGEERQAIYFWQGRHASNMEQGTAALLATDMHNEKFKGTSTLVRVAQSAEPLHFVALFVPSGGLVVHRGQRPEGGVSAAGVPAGPRLYQVKTDGTEAAHAVEVELAASALNSGDSFVLKTLGGAVMLWQGSGSNDSEKQLAAAAAARLSGGAQVTTVQEGQEPSNFWTAMPGGQQQYPRTRTSAAEQLPVLFHLRDTSVRGSMRVEASTTLSQEELPTTDCVLLDAGSQLFVWRGRETAPTEGLVAKKLADAYLVAQKGRAGMVSVVEVAQGAEPPFFTQHFAGWDAADRATIADVYQQRMSMKEKAAPHEM